MMVLSMAIELSFIIFLDTYNQERSPSYQARKLNLLVMLLVAQSSLGFPSPI